MQDHKLLPRKAAKHPGTRQKKKSGKRRRNGARPLSYIRHTTSVVPHAPRISSAIDSARIARSNTAFYHPKLEDSNAATKEIHREQRNDERMKFHRSTRRSRVSAVSPPYKLTRSIDAIHTPQASCIGRKLPRNPSRSGFARFHPRPSLAPSARSHIATRIRLCSFAIGDLFYTRIRYCNAKN
jgi:hypothetical protein